MSELSFKTEVFEGPLDLLLHLIGKNKVSICDIPISLITDQYFEYISLMQDLDMGVTYLEGTGAYTDKKKKIIMCVARKRVAPKVEEVVKSVDAAAFMIVTSASEIFGKGYKSYYSEKF